ncbi:MAG: RlpA-like double-psi beta-barrel domain-containing protein [Solirubrobacterales bacterium]
MAGLLAALLGTLALLAAPGVVAFADTGDATANTGTPRSGPSSEAPTSSAPTSGAPTSSAPTSGAPTAGAPEASGSTSGGAAPTPSPLGKVTLATWFGPGFYGRATACGQRMSPTLVGVASRTLPCGTLVQIGYRGRRLTVPVLDRGPYGHNGAVWDLTTGAARALKIKDTVHVTAQVVGRVPNTPALGDPATSGTPLTGTPSGPLAAPPSATAATTGGATAG